jgi:putative transposase
VEALATHIGVKPACDVLRVPRSSLYASRQPRVAKERVAAGSPRALSAAEKADVRRALDSARFQDQAPREVYATLLDEGRYLCSVSSLYRILRDNDEVRERRDQLCHPVYAKPELLATGPNQVWSWDITQLRGPAKWVYFYLYVLLDVFSRFVVGWLIAERESAAFAEPLIAESCARQGIQPDQLSIHSDRGGPMIAKSLAGLLTDLGVTPSLSRPHTPDDNPFSEAHFKTLKYHPTFPERFGCSSDARTWAQGFFHWYNYDHHHTGLALLTPADVHYGRAEAILQQRQQVLHAAYAAHPERFVKGPPRPAPLPTAVWINPPQPTPVAVVAAEAVDPVGNAQRSGALSTSPQPSTQSEVLIPDLSFRH